MPERQGYYPQGEETGENAKVIQFPKQAGSVEEDTNLQKFEDRGAEQSLRPDEEPVEEKPKKDETFEEAVRRKAEANRAPTPEELRIEKKVSKPKISETVQSMNKLMKKFKKHNIPFQRKTGKKK